MDSHIFKKAANRLPALADIAVLRFNTRGTESEAGRSDGEFGNGESEKYDVEAAAEYAFTELNLENLWVIEFIERGIRKEKFRGESEFDTCEKFYEMMKQYIRF